MELNPRLPVGRNLTLFCDVEAKPKPELLWFFNGTAIDESNAAGRHLLVGFGDDRRFIHIQNISLAHRGAFLCEASNAAGKDSIEYRVDVFQAPSIVKGSTEQVVEGRVALLECNASGEPPPLITWVGRGWKWDRGWASTALKLPYQVVDAHQGWVSSRFASRFSRQFGRLAF